MTITNGYCTADELSEHMGGADLNDAGADRAINAASRWIDEHTGRKFWLDPANALTTLVYRPEDPYTAWVNDIGSTTGLVIKTDSNGDGTWATTWASTDYQLEPVNPVGAFSYSRIVAIDRYTFPYHCRRMTLQVTARHGWSTVPDGVVTAALLISAALYQRRESALGVANAGGDFGPIRVSRFVDPDAARHLEPFRRYDLLVA